MIPVFANLTIGRICPARLQPLVLASLLLFAGNVRAQSAGNEFDPEVVSCSCPPTEARCTGTKIWTDGTEYQGEFKSGVIEGKGKLVFNDGSSYQGDFVSETFHGYGTMIYEDGSKYTGDWVDGFREGTGAWVMANGTEYLGEFAYDQIHGEGTILLSTGESYAGSWENGLTHGLGTIYRLDGSQYIGLSKEGERDGAGLVAWESGDTLFGNWEGGKMVDESIFQFEEGASMISFWENGIMKDTARYIQPDGFTVSAPATELAALVLDSADDEEIAKDNLLVAFYTIGMEYRSMLDYDRAESTLIMAAQFSDPLDPSPLLEVVETQLAALSVEKENAAVARKEEE